MIAMIKVALLALCVTSSMAIHPMHFEMMNLIDSEPVMKQKFKLWQHAVNRQYDLNSELAVNRYKVFKQNMKDIKMHNDKSLSYKYGLGQFTDLTEEEFRLNYLTYVPIHPYIIESIESQNQILPISRIVEIDFDTMADLEEEELKVALGNGELEQSNYLDIEFNEATSKILRPIDKIRFDEHNFESIFTTASHAAASLYDYYSPSDVKSSIQQLRECASEKNSWDSLLRALSYWRDVQPATDDEYAVTPKRSECKAPNNNILTPIKNIHYCSNLFSQKCDLSCSKSKVNNALQTGPYGTRIYFSQGLQHYIGGIIEGINVNDNYDCIVFAIVSGYEIDTDVFYVQTLFPNFPIMQISVSKNTSTNTERPVIALGAGSNVVQPRF